MTAETIKKYFRFVLANRPTYFSFNRQLVLGELAGFFAGVGVAEATTAFTRNEIAVSISSGAADYAGSILGFLAIFYHDNKSLHRDLPRKERLKRILKDALSLWPSVAAADIAYILARPYVHYLLLTYGFEAGIAATFAHFVSFGIFNSVAIVSRSIIDYARSKKQQ